MTRHRGLFLLFFVPFAFGCSTWGYTVEYEGAMNANAPETENTVVVEYVGSRTQGTLKVLNNSPETVYVVWNTASAVDEDGAQRKAYKGTTRRIHSELSLPDQPVASGARISETIVFDIDGPIYDRTQQRPATTIDYALGWVYGLGIWLGDLNWEPDEAHIETVIPNWKEKSMKIFVDIRTQDQVQSVGLEGTAKSVKTLKLGD